jgi:hypothetical protein
MLGGQAAGAIRLAADGQLDDLGALTVPARRRRLAGLLPHARLAEVNDGYTLIPLDQPARLAQIIREFTRVPGGRLTGAGALVGARSVPGSPRRAAGDAEIP